MFTHVQFVTSNVNKVTDARNALAKYGIRIQPSQIELFPSHAPDPSDVVREKAQQAFAILKRPCMVEDSAFFIRALRGVSKEHIKLTLETFGIKGILDAMAGTDDRYAEWRMSVAYAAGPGPEDTHVFTFVEQGAISTEMRDAHRAIPAEYWRIYAPMLEGRIDKTLSELSPEDIIVRAAHYAENNAFDLLGRWLIQQKP